jgi:hypothetical protein
MQPQISSLVKGWCNTKSLNGSKIRQMLIGLVVALAVAGLASADITTGLVRHWKLDDGAGTTAHDSSGFDNHGTLMGDPQWVDGQINGALDLDGIGDYVDFGNPTDLPAGKDDSSICGWAMTNTVASGWRWIVAYGSPAVGQAMFIGMNSDYLFGGGYADDVRYNNFWEVGVWHHICLTYDGTTARLYADGIEVASEMKSWNIILNRACIGQQVNNWAEFWDGMVDDVRIYNRVLTDDEIKKLSLLPKASGPQPEDGSMYEETWANLAWLPGRYAGSHDVYFGDNFDDIDDGTGGTFLGNVTETWFLIGFPGHPYPTGLALGTTYYWRIDTVNDLHPDSPWKGDVWSFWLPPKTAYDPDPADGAKFVDPNADLTWTAGWGGALHFVYFGDDFDTVNNATGAAPQAATTYDPGTMEFEKTYYWRVDEFDGAETHTGDVWSFTTVGPNAGVRVEFFDGMALEGPVILSRVDHEINWYWGSGVKPYPELPSENNFSIRCTAMLEALYSEPTIFTTGSDDGVRLYLDGEMIIENWTDHDRTENSSQPINLIAGQTYMIVLEGYENAGEAEWQLYWQSPSIPRQVIPAGPLSLPLNASSPRPPHGAVDVKQAPTLSWKAGEQAAKHNVYFGTDSDAVANATTASTGVYRGQQNLDETSYPRVTSPLEDESRWRSISGIF